MKIFKYMVEQELKDLEEIYRSYFYDYIDRVTTSENRLVRQEKNKKYMYYCTHCKRWHYDVKINVKQKKKCPYCNRKYEVITKRNVIPKIDGYITYLEINERNELIIRLFYFSKDYYKEDMDFKYDCFEVERINVDRNVYMKMNTHSNMGYIYHSKDGSIKKDNVSHAYYYNRRLGDVYPYKNVITKSIKKLIKKTDYKYSCLDVVAKKNIDILSYLKLYKKFSELELFVKNKNFELLKDILYNETIPYELENKRNFKYLKMDLNLNEFRNAVRFNEMDYEMIKAYTKVKALYDADRVYNYNHNIKKICIYLSKRNLEMNYYRDYIIDADKLGYDLNDKKVLYPDDLVKAHDEVMKNVEVLRNKEITKKIAKRSKELEKYNFNKYHLMIFPTHSQKELIDESKTLNHCVKSYSNRVANGDTNIFFIRQENKYKEPFVTLELQNNEVIQCRGKNNSKPNDTVISFVNDWCKKFNFKSCFSQEENKVLKEANNLS